MIAPDAAGPLVDTHCHLVLIEQRGYLEAALERAGAAGVAQIVTVGLNLEDSDQNRLLAERLPGVFFTVGWHPHETAPPDAAQLAALGELLDHPRAVAVGEVGLDRFWRPGHHETPLEVQTASLRAMLELAADRDKPVIIHDREAHDQTLSELARCPGARALMHCFSGDAAHAARCAAAGHLVSFSGTVTFPGNNALREVAGGVAPEGFVIETDAPFLAPQPHRGRPNEPAHMAATAAAVAAERGEPVEAVRRRTASTARAFFRLPQDDRLTHP